MAKILLIAADVQDRESLAALLKAKRHSVVTVDTLAFVDYDRADRIQAADIVIFDVTRITEEQDLLLRHVCQLPCRADSNTFTLCFSRVNHGPRFELAIERLGARYVYAG